jgi:hypothetical protein
MDTGAGAGIVMDINESRPGLRNIDMASDIMEMIHQW